MGMAYIPSQALGFGVLGQAPGNAHARNNKQKVEVAQELEPECLLRKYISLSLSFSMDFW